MAGELKKSNALDKFCDGLQLWGTRCESRWIAVDKYHSPQLDSLRLSSGVSAGAGILLNLHLVLMPVFFALLRTLEGL